MPPEMQQNLIGQALGNKSYSNVNFCPFMERNDAYLDYLLSLDIILDMSGSENWSLPSFQAVGLGKHGVILNATGMKEWARLENAVLVEPSDKVDVYDNVFFRKGDDYNQGKIYSFQKEAFYEGCDKAIQRYHKNKLNEGGLKLQQEFTYEKTTDLILKELQEIA